MIKFDDFTKFYQAGEVPDSEVRIWLDHLVSDTITLDVAVILSQIFTEEDALKFGLRFGSTFVNGGTGRHMGNDFYLTFMSYKGKIVYFSNDSYWKGMPGQNIAYDAKKCETKPTLQTNLKALTGEEIKIYHTTYVSPTGVTYYNADNLFSSYGLLGKISISLTIPQKYEKPMPDYVNICLVTKGVPMGKYCELGDAHDGGQLKKTRKKGVYTSDDFNSLWLARDICTEFSANMQHEIECTLVFPNSSKRLVDPINNSTYFKFCLADCGNLEHWLDFEHTII